MGRQIVGPPHFFFLLEWGLTILTAAFSPQTRDLESRRSYLEANRRKIPYRHDLEHVLACSEVDQLLLPAENKVGLGCTVRLFRLVVPGGEIHRRL